MVEGRENITAASAAYLNIAVEPTRNSLRSYVAPALARGSPRVFGNFTIHHLERGKGRQLLKSYRVCGIVNGKPVAL